MAVDQGLLIVGDSECGCLISLCVSVNAYFSGDRENMLSVKAVFRFFLQSWRTAVFAERGLRDVFLFTFY